MKFTSHALLATMPEMLVRIPLGVVRVEPEGLNWCRDPDGSEVLRGKCNGGQLVRAVWVNLTPLISRGVQRLMLEALASLLARLPSMPETPAWSGASRTGGVMYTYRSVWMKNKALKGTLCPFLQDVKYVSGVLRICLWSFGLKCPTDHLLYHVVNGHFWVEVFGVFCMHVSLNANELLLPIPLSRKGQSLYSSCLGPDTLWKSVYFWLSSLSWTRSCGVAVLHHYESFLESSVIYSTYCCICC